MKLLGIILVILVLGGGVYYVVNSDKSEDATMENLDAIMDDSGEMMEGDSTMNNDKMMEGETSMMEGGEMIRSSGAYEDYSPEKLVLADGGKVALFFHAPWCPTCRAIESEINKSANSIPEGVHILKVDYDTATSLKQKYGVTVQHTFVQVDSKGNSLQKFSDQSSLSGVLAKLK